jgi:hypothetical protein
MPRQEEFIFPLQEEPRECEFVQRECKSDGSEDNFSVQIELPREFKSGVRLMLDGSGIVHINRFCHHCGEIPFLDIPSGRGQAIYNP